MENLLQNPPKVGAVSDVASDSNYKYSAQAEFKWCNVYLRTIEGSTEHQFVYEIKTGRVTVTLQ